MSSWLTISRLSSGSMSNHFSQLKPQRSVFASTRHCVAVGIQGRCMGTFCCLQKLWDWQMPSLMQHSQGYLGSEGTNCLTCPCLWEPIGSLNESFPASLGYQGEQLWWLRAPVRRFNNDEDATLCHCDSQGRGLWCSGIIVFGLWLLCIWNISPENKVGSQQVQPPHLSSNARLLLVFLTHHTVRMGVQYMQFFPKGNFSPDSHPDLMKATFLFW